MMSLLNNHDVNGSPPGTSDLTHSAMSEQTAKEHIQGSTGDLLEPTSNADSGNLVELFPLNLDPSKVVLDDQPQLKDTTSTNVDLLTVFLGNPEDRNIAEHVECDSDPKLNNQAALNPSVMQLNGLLVDLQPPDKHQSLDCDFMDFLENKPNKINSKEKESSEMTESLDNMMTSCPLTECKNISSDKSIDKLSLALIPENNDSEATVFEQINDISTQQSTDAFATSDGKDIESALAPYDGFQKGENVFDSLSDSKNMSSNMSTLDLFFQGDSWHESSASQEVIKNGRNSSDPAYICSDSIDHVHQTHSALCHEKSDVSVLESTMSASEANPTEYFEDSTPEVQCTNEQNIDSKIGEVERLQEIVEESPNVQSEFNVANNVCFSSLLFESNVSSHTKEAVSLQYTFKPGNDPLLWSNSASGGCETDISAFQSQSVEVVFDNVDGKTSSDACYTNMQVFDENYHGRFGTGSLSNFAELQVNQSAEVLNRSNDSVQNPTLNVLNDSQNPSDMICRNNSEKQVTVNISAPGNGNSATQDPGIKHDVELGIADMDDSLKTASNGTELSSLQSLTVETSYLNKQVLPSQIDKKSNCSMDAIVSSPSTLISDKQELFHETSNDVSFTTNLEVLSTPVKSPEFGVVVDESVAKSLQFQTSVVKKIYSEENCLEKRKSDSAEPCCEDSEVFDQSKGTTGFDVIVTETANEVEHSALTDKEENLATVESGNVPTWRSDNLNENCLQSDLNSDKSSTESHFHINNPLLKCVSEDGNNLNASTSSEDDNSGTTSGMHSTEQDQNIMFHTPDCDPFFEKTSLPTEALDCDAFPSTFASSEDVCGNDHDETSNCDKHLPESNSKMLSALLGTPHTVDKVTTPQSSETKNTSADEDIEVVAPAEDNHVGNCENENIYNSTQISTGNFMLMSEVKSTGNSSFEDYVPEVLLEPTEDSDKEYEEGSSYVSECVIVSDLDSTDNEADHSPDNVSFLSLEFDDIPFPVVPPVLPPRNKHKTGMNENNFESHGFSTVPSTVFVNEEDLHDVHIAEDNKYGDPGMKNNEFVSSTVKDILLEINDAQLASPGVMKMSSIVSIDSIWEELQQTSATCSTLPVIQEESEPEEDVDYINPSDVTNAKLGVDPAFNNCYDQDGRGIVSPTFSVDIHALEKGMQLIDRAEEQGRNTGADIDVTENAVYNPVCQLDAMDPANANNIHDKSHKMSTSEKHVESAAVTNVPDVTHCLIDSSSIHGFPGCKESSGGNTRHVGSCEEPVKVHSSDANTEQLQENFGFYHNPVKLCDDSRKMQNYVQHPVKKSIPCEVVSSKFKENDVILQSEQLYSACASQVFENKVVDEMQTTDLPSDNLVIQDQFFDVSEASDVDAKKDVFLSSKEGSVKLQIFNNDFVSEHSLFSEKNGRDTQIDEQNTSVLCLVQTDSASPEIFDLNSDQRNVATLVDTTNGLPNAEQMVSNNEDKVAQQTVCDSSMNEISVITSTDAKDPNSMTIAKPLGDLKTVTVVEQGSGDAQDTLGLCHSELETVCHVTDVPSTVDKGSFSDAFSISCGHLSGLTTHVQCQRKPDEASDVGISSLPTCVDMAPTFHPTECAVMMSSDFTSGSTRDVESGSALTESICSEILAADKNHSSVELTNNILFSASSSSSMNTEPSAATETITYSINDSNLNAETFQGELSDNTDERSEQVVLQSGDNELAGIRITDLLTGPPVELMGKENFECENTDPQLTKDTPLLVEDVIASDSLEIIPLQPDDSVHVLDQSEHSDVVGPKKIFNDVIQASPKPLKKLVLSPETRNTSLGEDIDPR